MVNNKFTYVNLNEALEEKEEVEITSEKEPEQAEEEVDVKFKYHGVSSLLTDLLKDTWTLLDNLKSAKLNIEDELDGQVDELSDMLDEMITNCTVSIGQLEKGINHIQSKEITEEELEEEDKITLDYLFEFMPEGFKNCKVTMHNIDTDEEKEIDLTEKEFNKDDFKEFSEKEIETLESPEELVIHVDKDEVYNSLEDMTSLLYDEQKVKVLKDDEVLFEGTVEELIDSDVHDEYSVNDVDVPSELTINVKEE